MAATTASTAPEADPYADDIKEARAILAEVGLSGIADYVVNEIRGKGLSYDAIVQNVRFGLDPSEAGQAATGAYKAAFPGIEQVIDKGVFPKGAGSPERQYFDYREAIKGMAPRYNLDERLVSSDRILRYILSGQSFSEITERVARAAVAAQTIPAEARTFLRDNYGVQDGDLISFYLEPEMMTEVLDQRYAAARISAEATKQQFGIDRLQAEAYAAQFGSGEANIEQARAAVQQAAQASELTGGVGETLTQQELLDAAAGDIEAQRKARRVTGVRAGQFEQGGGFAEGRGGIAGLGSAATM